jgi:site-specific DNA-methyltransferase (cytosine-N4-specific)
MPEPLYSTELGKAYVGDALELLGNIPDNNIDLIITSPPFALQREKEYGNEAQNEYVEWISKFATEIYRVLKEKGSFVLDLGGAYKRGRPVRTLYNYRVLIKFCDDYNFKLAEEFFWFNPSKLPSPIEWVNKRKIRVKDAVNTIWWFSKSDFPKADIKKVLVPYSERMKKLIEDPGKYYKPKSRPSGHNIGSKFGQNSNGGAIPPNLLQIANTESNSKYLRMCKVVGIKGHPARFPEKLPAFFVKMLTEEGDLILDIFAGSNTTGFVAETNNRKWIAFEMSQNYLAASSFRFVDFLEESELFEIYEELSTKVPSNFKINTKTDLLIV